MSTMPSAKHWDGFWQGRKGFADGIKVSWSKRRICHALEPYLKPGGWALDAGCGSGFFARYFLEKGMRVYALDYSRDALALTRTLTQGQARLFQKDLLADPLMDFLDEPCDLIFTDGLLEHFSREEQQAILRNFMSVLKPEGKIITFVPNRWSPWELIRPFVMPGIDEVPFTLAELKKLHRSVGLAVESSGGVNTLPFAFSPDSYLGSTFGMLLYVVLRRNI